MYEHHATVKKAAAVVRDLVFTPTAATPATPATPVHYNDQLTRYPQSQLQPPPDD